MTNRYWLTPPDLYAQLDAEFHFDFDPCPFPLPANFDGLAIPWGKSSYVNPPFRRGDAATGKGPTAFARKAIAEHAEGRRSVCVMPIPSYVALMLDAGAEIRNLGRVRWLECDTGEPWPEPRIIAAFILRK